VVADYTCVGTEDCAYACAIGTCPAGDACGIGQDYTVRTFK
jgi:hypothetical protein